jgi:hypothetical protein
MVFVAIVGSLVPLGSRHLLMPHEIKWALQSAIPNGEFTTIRPDRAALR